MTRLAIPAILLIATLGGCAPNGDYPSLAPRPIEGMSLAEPAARPIAAPTPATASDARYAPVVERARAGDRGFRAALDEAAPMLRAGRSAGVGSDAWGAAQTRLSRLQSLRAPVVAALAELQAAGEAPATQADRGLADAAARALDAVRAIDAAEASALADAAPIGA